jgi:hypothetical protein
MQGKLGELGDSVKIKRVSLLTFIGPMGSSRQGNVTYSKFLLSTHMGG